MVVFSSIDGKNPPNAGSMFVGSRRFMLLLLDVVAVGDNAGGMVL